jgi:hypothetical protein
VFDLHAVPEKVTPDKSKAITAAITAATTAAITRMQAPIADYLPVL